MAVTLVQQSPGTTTAITLVSAASSGNFLIALISSARGAGARTVSSIACTNVSWVRLAGAINTPGDVDAEIWIGTVSGTSGTAVTLTMSGANAVVSSNILEVSGVSSTVDPVAVLNGAANTNSATTASYTTTGSGDFVVAMKAHNGATNTVLTSPSSPWTAITSAQGSTAGSLAGAYQLAAGAGSQSATWGLDSTYDWETAIVALLATSSAVGITAGTLSPRFLFFDTGDYSSGV